MQREAPMSASAPPPAYARFIPGNSIRKDLRPAVILVASFSCIYGIIAGAAVLRRRNNYDGYLPSSLEAIYLVLAILYFACSAIEAFGVAAAWKASIKLVRTYFYGSVATALIVTAAEVLRLVVHYSQKSTIQKACRDSYANDISRGTTTTSEVEGYCSDSWRNASYLDIALLVFSLFLSFFFASLAASYLHQLKNPQLLRTQAPHLAPSAAYAPPYGVPLQPYPSNLPPYGQSPYAPPNYPPGGGPPPGHSTGFEPGRVPEYDNPYGYKAGSDDKHQGDESNGRGGSGGAGSNPFEDHVEHQPQRQGPTTLLIRRPGETVDEFELRQHEHDLEVEAREEEERRRRRGAEGGGFGFGAGESTETITLEGNGKRI